MENFDLLDYALEKELHLQGTPKTTDFFESVVARYMTLLSQQGVLVPTALHKDFVEDIILEIQEILKDKGFIEK